MSFTKISSTYPVWLPPLPKQGLPGEWINLANVESLIFEPKKDQYVLRFSSGAYRQIEASRACVISDEFRAMCEARRSAPSAPKTKNPT